MLPELKVKIGMPTDKLSADAREAKQEIAGVGVAVDRVGKTAVRTDRQMTRLGRSMRVQRGGARQLAMQLSQVGQQTMATGNLIQSLAIQLPDIGLAFGTVGTAVGLVAGIALPMLVSAFSDAGDAANKAKDDVDSFKEALTALDDERQSLSRDLFATRNRITNEALVTAEMEKQLLLTEQQRLLDKAAGLNQVRQRVEVLKLQNKAAEIGNQIVDLDEKSAGINKLIASLKVEERKEAQEIVRIEKLKADFIDSAREAAERLAGTDMASAVNRAADAAARLARNFWEALGAAGALVQGGVDPRSGKRYSGRGTSAGAGSTAAGQLALRQGGWITPPSGVAGGGGGGGESLSDRLATVRDALALETEIAKNEYAERQEILQEAFDKRLLTQQQFEQLSLRSAQEYRDAMSGAESGYQGDTLSQAETFFGEMANAMRSGGEEMARIAKASAAAEALVNAWRAYNQVLADPTLPFIAKIPAAASVLAAGMGAVNAIKSSGSGGGGGSGAVASATSAPPRQVDINLSGGGELIPRSAVLRLIDEINNAADENGVVIRMA